MRIAKGLATGIGSFPGQDAKSALDLIFKYVPCAPFWPQLPKRDLREGMVAQFSENLPCIRVTDSGIFFDAEEKDKELEIFYEKVIADDKDYFKISDNFALGLHEFYRRLGSSDLNKIDFIKLQVTGPFTFLASINNENGVMLMHEPVFRQAMLKGLIMKLRWQAEFFTKFGRPIIAFIDEPYLGCLGSAYAAIGREEVVAGLNEFGEAFKDSSISLGVHCCGNTDWSIFMDVPYIDIINFDAFNFQERFVLYADNLKAFLKRGGIICWGIVPTEGLKGDEAAGLLFRKIRLGIDALVKKGVEEKLLLENLMISPACGLGTLKIDEPERIYKLLHETSLYIRENL